MMLWEFLKNKMQENLDQKVCENEAVMTYEELIVFAETFVPKLKGVQCCAILCSSEMAAAMAILCCIAADVTVLPLSQRYGAQHCNKILDAIQPDAIIIDRNGELQVLHISDSNFLPPLQKPVFIMCTSGTTGKPKGAMLTKENVISNITDISSYFSIDHADTILIARPLYHCAVLTGEFLVSLVKGVKIHFYSDEFNPVLMLEIIRRDQITVFCSTPTMLGMMARFQRDSKATSLNHIVISGECMAAQDGRRISQAFPDAEIYHVYGLTEASPRVAYLPPELFAENPDRVGVPLNSVTIRVLSKKGKTVGVNEIGFLWVKGPSVMIGYYNDAEKTAEVIKKGWLCTGDLASFNEDGILKIHGRSDDLIIRAGMNIYPQEIECVIKQDPRVKEVRVLGKNKNRRVQIIMDVVGDFESSVEVKVLCRELLPSYQIPNKINLVKELPKNGSGKIVRR